MNYNHIMIMINNLIKVNQMLPHSVFLRSHPVNLFPDVFCSRTSRRPIQNVLGIISYYRILSLLCIIVIIYHYHMSINYILIGRAVEQYHLNTNIKPLYDTNTNLKPILQAILSKV